MVETIKRRIKKEDRFLEILDSMRNPQISIIRSDVGVPSVNICAIAQDGIYEYQYNHSGVIGIDSLLENLSHRMQPTDYIVEEDTRSRIISHIVDLSNKLDTNDLHDLVHTIKSKYRFKL